MRKFLLIFSIGIILGFIIYKGNTTVGTSFYEIDSNRLPPSFEGYKIVQLSDLHDAKFGENHEDVVRQVKNIAPNAIFITGDLIDSNRYNLEQSLILVKELQHEAPIYFVTGNHEISTNDVNRIKESLQQLGVRVLSNEREVITSDKNESIAIGGIEDPLSSTFEDEDAVKNSVAYTFENLPSEMFKILLSHRPELFDIYVDNQVDLTFSGHAHGGQFRLPGVGGLLSPGQGWFPKLTSGIHEQDDSQIVVSRGLGNSLMPLRLFNQPEIVVVTLRKSEG